MQDGRNWPALTMKLKAEIHSQMGICSYVTISSVFTSKDQELLW